nr:MAG TPA: hypothetical protein [Caudoviricetes sp.]
MPPPSIFYKQKSTVTNSSRSHLAKVLFLISVFNHRKENVSKFLTFSTLT